MAQLDLPLPEITVEDFARGWTRFELVSTAKEWEPEKQAKIVPTLLCGKLVKKDLNLLKEALTSKAGLVRDPLTAGKMFISRSQRAVELVN